GSAAKPFTYAAAIASRTITPATVIQDAPVQIRLASNQVWNPKDYDGQFRGPVTVREAFEKSLNIPAVLVAQQVGVDRVQNVWHQAGFTGDLSNTPAIALGVDDVSMRDVVAAYSIFPNLGNRSEPYLIERVTKGSGSDIYNAEPKQTPAIDPAVAYVIHSLMRGVVMYGTAARLNQYGLGNIAGKTGTTSNYRDAWFVGYSPDLLTAVWVGFDDGTPLRMSSGEAVVPMWGAYMQQVAHSKGELAVPPGVSVVEVEAQTGLLYQPGCGIAVAEVFLSGTEPRTSCGGTFDQAYVMNGFEEPPMLTDQQAAAMSDEALGIRKSQVIIDSAEASDTDTTELDVGYDSTQLLQVDTLRRDTRQPRRPSRALPPTGQPPVNNPRPVSPPEVRPVPPTPEPPPAPPPEAPPPPAPPARDTLSLTRFR
ncbi:MAG: penicillin-binding transpeptidase domain-containing protein, partial [Gemmatimonadales bacterium]